MRGPLWDPVLLEPDPEHVLVQQDGVIREHVNQIMSAEMAGQVADGYRCINCLEAFLDGAWPETCFLCGFPVKEKQAERYALEFKGNVRVGPSTSIEEELAIAEELVEQRELAKFGMKKTNSIVVPGWARA